MLTADDAFVFILSDRAQSSCLASVLSIFMNNSSDMI
jgi:hypothetical protein